MQAFSNLGEWVIGKWKTQAALAEKMQVKQGQISRWISGENEISEGYKEQIRGLGYKGPWPEKKARGAQASAAGPFLTVEAFAEWRGYWKGGMEGVLERLEKAEKAVADLKDQVRKLSPPEDKT